MRNEIRLFWRLVGYTPDMIFVVIPETGRLFNVNRSECGRLGYAFNELLTMCLWDIDEVRLTGRKAEFWRRPGHHEITTLESVNLCKGKAVLPIEVAFLGLSMADFQFCLLLFEISPIASEQRSILGFGCRNLVSRNQGTVANCRQLLLTQISGVHESLPIFCKK